MVILLSGVVASAAVRVDDPDDCLRQESLDLEARSALGDDVVERYDIYARVEPGAGADERELHLEVAEDGITVWRREVGFEEVDCPYLASLVVLSVERGLSEVPKWVLKHGPRARPIPEVGFLLFATSPAEAPRWGGTVLGSTGLLLPWLRVQGAFDLFHIPHQDVGLGSVESYGLALSAGLAGDVVRFDDGSWRVGGRVGGGPAFLHGQEPDTIHVRPRFSVTFDTTFAIGPYLRVLVPVLEVPFLDLQVGDSVTGEILHEPSLRWGAAIGVTLPVRRD